MAAAKASGSMRLFRAKMNPREWLAWLEGPNAIPVLGAGPVRQEIKRLRKYRARIVSDAASAAWVQSYDDGCEVPPFANDPPTPHGIRMVMSCVSGRYTPPQCLKLEDELDAMSPHEAHFYESPDGSSPSAQVIQRIAAMQAKEIGGRRGR